METGIIIIKEKRVRTSRQIKKTRKNVNKIVGKLFSQRSYNRYGKVLRVRPSKLFKRALIFDLVVPCTFFVPVILAAVVYVITCGQEFTITRRN